MRKLKALVVLALASGFFDHPFALGREVKALTLNWEPYYGESLKKQGVITSIVKEAFKLKKIDFSVQFVPWKRALIQVKKGTSDIVMGAYHSPERKKDYILSEPFYDIEVGLVGNKDIKIDKFKSFEDLKNFEIGVARGFVNSEEFDKATFLNKNEAKNQLINIRKLIKKRIDLIAIAYDIFKYETSKMGKNQNDFKYIKPSLAVNQLHLLGSRKVKDMKSIIQTFNAGLRELKSSKRFAAILDEFGF